MDRPPTLRDRAAGVQRRGAGWGRVAVLIGSSGTISRDAPIARCRGRRSRSDVSVMAGRRPARVRVGGRLWLCADRWQPKGRLSAGVGGFVRTDGCREGCSWPAFVALCGRTSHEMPPSADIRGRVRRNDGGRSLAACRKPQDACRKPQDACRKPQDACRKALSRLWRCAERREPYAPFRPAFAALCGKTRDRRSSSYDAGPARDLNGRPAALRRRR